MKGPPPETEAEDSVHVAEEAQIRVTVMEDDVNMHNGTVTNRLVCVCVVVVNLLVSSISGSVSPPPGWSGLRPPTAPLFICSSHFSSLGLLFSESGKPEASCVAQHRPPVGSLQLREGGGLLLLHSLSALTSWWPPADRGLCFCCSIII